MDLGDEKMIFESKKTLTKDFMGYMVKDMTSLEMKDFADFVQTKVDLMREVLKEAKKT